MVSLLTKAHKYTKNKTSHHLSNSSKRDGKIYDYKIMLCII